jgi:protein-tyrosine phosphatase
VLRRPPEMTSDTPAELRQRGALWLAFLGTFFFASYGLANWAAGLRPVVGTVVFGWERDIPFLPWTIVPYWSIDFIYVAALLTARSRGELDILARRLLAAQLIAVSCFLLYPLRYSFDRPATSGIFGSMFALLDAFDQPYNQAPSLHIALLVVLWGHYRNRVRGSMRRLLLAVCAMIAVSVLTTRQHHFIDIPTGAWLGWLCTWLFPVAGRPMATRVRLASDPIRCRIGLRYALLCVGTGFFALALGGAWLWALWAAASFAIVAAAYLLLGPAAFQKQTDGSMSTAALWLLGPYLIGAWANSRWWTRRIALYNRVSARVALGRIPSRRELAGQAPDAVVDLSAELPFLAPVRHYQNIPMLDLVAARPEDVEEGCLAIEAAQRRGTVLVCCALGFSRSATVAAAWLIRSGQARSVEEAIAKIRAARPPVVLGSIHTHALQAWHDRYRSCPASNDRCAPTG